MSDQKLSSQILLFTVETTTKCSLIVHCTVVLWNYTRARNAISELSMWSNFSLLVVIWYELYIQEVVEISVCQATNCNRVLAETLLPNAFLLCRPCSILPSYKRCYLHIWTWLSTLLMRFRMQCRHFAGILLSLPLLSFCIPFQDCSVICMKH